MENIDDLKAQWKNTNVRLNNIESEIDNIVRSRRRNNLELLARSYRAMALVAVLMLASAYPFWRFMLGQVEHPNPVAPIAYAAVFVVNLIADTMLWFRVRAIRVDSMTVMEVAERAARCRRLHLLSQCVMLPIAGVFLVALALMSADPSFLGSMAVGACLGGWVGVRKWRQMMRAYRELSHPDSLTVE